MKVTRYQLTISQKIGGKEKIIDQVTYRFYWMAVFGAFVMSWTFCEYTSHFIDSNIHMRIDKIEIQKGQVPRMQNPPPVPGKTPTFLWASPPAGGDQKDVK